MSVIFVIESITWVCAKHGKAACIAWGVYAAGQIRPVSNADRRRVSQAKAGPPRVLLRRGGHYHAMILIFATITIITGISLIAIRSDQHEGPQGLNEY